MKYLSFYLNKWSINLNKIFYFLSNPSLSMFPLKVINNYSYFLNNAIGKGFSTTVYKGNHIHT